MITGSSIQDALQPFLGVTLAGNPEFLSSISHFLRACSPTVDSFPELTRNMEDRLFNLLYETLGPGMTVSLPDGTSRRILMEDLPFLADEALYPFFASLPRDQGSVEMLQGWWMASGSWSALRALFLNFSGFLPASELRMIERIVRENIPPALHFRWFSL